MAINVPLNTQKKRRKQKWKTDLGTHEMLVEILFAVALLVAAFQSFDGITLLTFCRLCIYRDLTVEDEVEHGALMSSIEGLFEYTYQNNY